MGMVLLDRARRVRILKRIIVITILTLIILPTVLCALAFMKISENDREISFLNESIDELGTEISELKWEISNRDKQLSDAISASENVALENAELREQLEKLTIIKGNVRPTKVYLTFDDGPSAHTQDILDILGEYDIKATFFVCATKNPDYEKFYQMIIDNGHTLGIHSFTHVYDEIYASSDDFYDDVSSIYEYVYEHTDGYEASFYRFPGGSNNSNMVLKLEDYVSTLDNLNLTYFDWNISSKDATNPMQPKEVLFKNATDRSQEYDEVMILMHDLGNKDSTVEVLPEIIEYYKNIGSTFCAIDETTVPIRLN